MDRKSMVSQSRHIKMIQYILVQTPVQNHNKCNLVLLVGGQCYTRPFSNEESMVPQVLQRKSLLQLGIGEVAW